MEISNSLREKLTNLTKFLTDKKVIVAFSGGVDSSLLAFLSNKHAIKTLLVIGSSTLFSDKEIREASEFAERYDIPYLIIEVDPLEDELFSENPPNRCYYCKKLLYSEILNIKDQNNYDMVIDGTNISELEGHRPGYRALQELDISVPYVNFNLGKEDIRTLSKYFGLSLHAKPANACFATRIEYGLSITNELMGRIKSAENFLRDRFNLIQLRVRHHHGNLARIEVLKDELLNICNQETFSIIEDKFKELGFTYVTIDLGGFKSGSMDRNLDI
ncbi:MAG: ATP-dependent sacrificial sulfur transferase LarE [Candidatus Lokiarchaeota archaeon]|nr:ATP-dependent sacrificial sulfur transferase LarE [Candidatus Lokiarchaeota archaeon]